MSAPDTRLKKQAKRHKGPLIGMIIGVTFAVSALVWMLSTNVTADPDTPANSDAQVEGTIEGTVGPPARGAVSAPGGADAPQMDEAQPAPSD